MLMAKWIKGRGGETRVSPSARLFIWRWIWHRDEPAGRENIKEAEPEKQARDAQSDTKSEKWI